MKFITKKHRRLPRRYQWVVGAMIIVVFFLRIIGNVSEKNEDNPNHYSASTIVSSHQKTNVEKSVRSDLYDVVHIVDGDTIDVQINGVKERIRLIGINTPETVDSRKPVECFGTEASHKAKTILAGKKVALTSDYTQGDRDKYGRFLRYVFLEDGTNFNLLMIREGFAYEYTYKKAYVYQSIFKEAQQKAQAGKEGLWGALCMNKYF